PITITVDTTAPEITIISPVNDAVVSVAAVEIVGNISEAANVFIDGEPMVVSQEGRFSTTRELLEGINEFHIVAEDRAGNSGTFDLRVHRDTSAPATVSPSNIHFVFNSDTWRLTGTTGAAERGARVAIRSTRTGDVGYAVA